MSINKDIPKPYRGMYKKFNEKGNWEKNVAMIKGGEASFRVVFSDIELQLVLTHRGLDPSIIQRFTPSEDNRNGTVMITGKGPSPVPDDKDIELYTRTILLLGVEKGTLRVKLLGEINGLLKGETLVAIVHNDGEENARLICSSIDSRISVEGKLKSSKDKKLWKKIQSYT